jgi:hypothetical protein
MNGDDTTRATLHHAQRYALFVGAIGAGFLIIFGLQSGVQFFRSYLLGFLYWLVFPAGCMAILMLHHLTGGWWGYPIRRLLEAGTRTFGLMAILFVPLLLGLPRLYEWAQPAKVAQDPILQYKHPYLNLQFFTVRAVIYFAIWIGLAWLLNSWSAEQDATGDPRFAKRLEGISGPGLILWGLAATYAAIDWIMSLEAHWFSTIFGMIVMVISVLSAISFVVFVLRKLSTLEPIARGVSASQFNDLGNLMLTFVMLWAYLSFSQFLIIWAGNIKDEITWYTSRAFGGWGAIAVVLIVLYFALPFVLLLQRGIKRRVGRLAPVAGLLIVLSLIDMFWMVEPAFNKDPHFHFLDLFAVVGVGGIWVGAFFWELKKRPLLPQRDPQFAGALEHEHGD